MNRMMLSKQENIACMNEVLDAADSFVEIVVPCVVKDRLEEAPSSQAADKQKKIASGKAVDVRPVRLMSISGKGGHHPDPAKAAHFSQWSNISLLDHLASVARGAATIVALEYAYARAGNGFDPGASSDMPQLLGLAMAIGFLHDANKCLDGGNRSNSDLLQGEVAELVERYGIDQFLAQQGWPSQDPNAWEPVLHHLLRGSEVNQSDEDVLFACRDAADLAAQTGSGLTPDDIERAVRAVRRADRMDGAWLKGGVDALAEEMEALGNEDLGQWSALVLREPHLPFLLDRLLLAIERECVEQVGLPPPVLSHMDGDLVALLPSPLPEGFFAKVMARLQDLLPFGLEVKLNNKKGLAVLGGQPSWSRLVAHVQGLGANKEVRKCMDLMSIHKDLSPSALPELRAAWDVIGMGNFIAAATVDTLGKYDQVVPVAQVEAMLGQPAIHWNSTFAPLQALVIALLAEPGKDPGNLTPDARIKAFGDFISNQGWALPQALSWDRQENFTNAISMVFWAVPNAIAAGKINLLWEFGKTLMEGHSTSGSGPAELAAHLVGTTQLFPKAWQDDALAQLSQRWGAMVEGKEVALSPDEEAQGPRCLFLDIPLPGKTDAIGSEFGLYQVKASAFSGRSGRPDNLMDAPPSPRNYISPIMRLEHALRQLDFVSLGQAGKGVAVTVSTPLRAGLFAGIRAVSDEVASFESKPRDVSTFELLTQDTGKRFIETLPMVMEQALPKEGYRLSRFESLPNRMEDRIGFYLRWARAARRFGRPVHLFRGVAHPTKAYFAIDTLSRELETWLGGRQWRLEQIPELIERLRLAEWALDKSNGGPGLPWFQRLVDPNTQWVVAAWLLNRDSMASSDDPRMPSTSRELLQTILKQHMENIMSNTNTDATVMQQLAAHNAAFQAIKGAFYKLSNTERALVWNLARESWEKHRDNHLSAEIPAEDFVEGNIRDALSRKGKLVETASSRLALAGFSRLFVANAQKLVGKPDLRQAITGAYVHLFEKAVAEYWQKRNEENSQPQE